MNERFEEKKNALLENLAKEYAPKKKKFFWNWYYNEYISTVELANTTPYYQSSEEIAIYKYNFKALLFISILEVSFLIFFLVALFLSKDYKFLILIFAIVFQIFHYKYLFQLLDRKEKMIISKDGIFSCMWGITINWDDIIATYILNKYRRNEITNFLIIHHYDDIENAFKCSSIKVTDLKIIGNTNNTDSNIKILAFNIEYIKMIAGKFKEKLADG
jgi:hypothetical protein